MIAGSDRHDRMHDERSLGELFNDLTRELTTLLRQEWLLAKTELSQKAAGVGRAIGMLALGGAVAYAGFLAIIAAIIIGLATLGLAWWLSGLIVGLVVAAAGGIAIWQGLVALRTADLAPRQTIETLREDAQVLKREAR